MLAIKSKLIIILFLFFSCSKSERVEIIDNNNIIPPSPPIHLFTSEPIDGYDVDRDGVRDDIELLINDKISDPNLRMALKEEVRTMIQYMNSISSFQAIELDKKMRNDMYCTAIVNESTLKIPSLQFVFDQVLNTEERRSKFNNIAKMIPRESIRKTFRSMSILSQFKLCSFPVVNLKSLLRKYYVDGSYKDFSNSEEKKVFQNMFED